MKTKYFCRKCGTELGGAYGYCATCQEYKHDYDVDKRYFPDNPKNKVFAVDAHVTICKCMKVEAASKAKAERLVANELAESAMHRTDAEWIHGLADMGFSDAEELKVRTSGKADENGDIEYY